ncbi:MAG TPA: hypothetical protein DEG44_04545 [Candidatus Kerfeldbacteria bacterium]|nr:hypothetical protein [Candidatus Kerfeldbacteria bacterium]
MKLEKFKRYYIWIILVVAAVLRGSGLTSRDFWYDEAFTGVAIKQSWHSMMSVLISDTHPPLYYFLVKIFAAPFNYSVVGIRLFSVLCGVVAVWAVYRLARHLFSSRVAWYAAAITALSPFAIQYSQEARMYSLLAVLILLATDWFMTGLKTKQTKYFVYWGIFTGLSFLTHYISLFFAVLFYVVYLIWKKPTHWKNFLPSGQLLIGYGIAGVIFLPWLPQFIHQLNRSGANLNWVASAHLGDIAATIQMFLFGTLLGELSAGMSPVNTLYGIQNNSVQMVITIVLTVGLVWLWRKTEHTSLKTIAIFSIGFMVLIYLISVTIPSQQYFVSRYLSLASYFLFILFALLLAQWQWRTSLGLIGVYICLILLIAPHTNSRGFNEMSQYLGNYAGQHFYVLSPADYLIGKYYFGGDRLTLYNKKDPKFNPGIWAGMEDIQRTESEADIQNDPTGLILSSVPLDHDLGHFSVVGLRLVQQYENIYVYTFRD